tara:strand:- start:171 stop:353 length:183 start_codon:yes stop_codon:yes gene_type:complete
MYQLLLEVMSDPISDALYKNLACPVCKGELTKNDKGLYCKKCTHTYPIKDDIPILTPPEN